jgi:hypothetical protein
LPNFFAINTSAGKSNATRRRAPRPPTAGNCGTPEGAVVDVEDDVLDDLTEV